MITISNIKIADRGYYINLDGSTDRKVNVESQIEKFNIVGLERFSALTDPARFLSCTKSHLQIFKESEEETLLILEDDFQLYDKCKINNQEYDFIQTLSNVMEELKNIQLNYMPDFTSTFEMWTFRGNPVIYCTYERNKIN
jgi:hypothetical protein